MENKIAVLAIVAENRDSAEQLNRILHEYGQYIVGRMGIPYLARSINVISVVVDAPHDVISAMAGKIGTLPAVNIKTAYSGCNEQ